MNRLVIFLFFLCRTDKTAAAVTRQPKFYAGYILVIRSRTGMAREKMLISQGYRVFLDRNIRARQPAVIISGMVTAL